MSLEASSSPTQDDEKLIQELCALSSPVEAMKHVETSPELLDRARKPHVAMALLSHFFRIPMDILNRSHGTPQPFLDVRSIQRPDFPHALDASQTCNFYDELVELSNTLWPLLHKTDLSIVSAGNRTTSGRSIKVTSNTSLQLAEPLQPLPVASGRLRYLEFEVSAIEKTSAELSLLIGVGLPGIEGPWTGKTRGSVAVDFISASVYEGSRIAHTLPPIVLKQGDHIGIGMSFECHNDEQQMDVFFATLNGTLLFESRSLASANRGFLLPSIYATGLNAQLTANHGAEPFRFDLSLYQQTLASHPFYRNYLPFNPSNVEGTDSYWTTSRICHQFAFHSQYRPIGDAMKHLTDSAYHEKVAALQIQIFRWQKIFALFHRDESEDAAETLPKHFDSQSALQATLIAEDLNPFQVDFNGDIPAIRRSILRSLTDLRYDIQLELLKIAAEFYSNRPSLYEDAQEIRSGLFEGHIKLALHLAKASQEPCEDRSWLNLVMNYTFDDLVHSEIDLAANCPGYMNEELSDDADTDGHAGDADVEGENANMESPDVGAAKNETSAEDEDELARRMVAIGSVVRAWASWAGAYIGGLELKLSASPESPAELSAVPKDVTLSYLSRGLVSSLKDHSVDPETGLPVGASWLLMQYVSLGFGQKSSLNELPLSLNEAIPRAETYFNEFISTFTPEDLALLQADVQLLASSQEDNDLEYLKHQYQLATGTWPTQNDLCNVLQLQAPAGVLDAALAPPALPKRLIEPVIAANPSSSSDQGSSSPSGPIPNSWIIAAGLGIAFVAASLGAAVAVWATSRPRKSKN